MAGIAGGEEIFDEDKNSWEIRIIAPDGTELTFACNRAENYTVLHTDFEQFCCGVHGFPELHVLPFQLGFYFGEEVQLNEEEFVGAVSDGFRRSLNAEICDSLEADAQANNGRAMVSVHIHQHSGELCIFYSTQDFTIQVTIEEEEQISSDVVQDQNVIHEITEDSDDDSENEDEEYFWDSESSEISDEEAAQILGSPSEGINYDWQNVCVICLDSFKDRCEDIKQLPCKHIYHYKCILRSTKIKNSCPLCRGKFDCRETQSN